MESRAGSHKGVCVVGVGAKTPVGTAVPSSSAAVRAGVSGFGEHPFVIDRRGEPVIVARVPQLSLAKSGTDRFLALAIEPMREACMPLFPYRRGLRSIPLFLGLPPRRPGRPDDLERRLEDGIRNELEIDPAAIFTTGHAAGLMALEAASRRVVSGSAEFCLAGGVDSYLEPDTLEWLESNDQLHGGSNPYGFIPGEAAGFCLVCLVKTAERRQLAPLGYVITAATAKEAKLIKTDAICLGKGLTEVFQKVFADLPSSSDKIENTVCDMNGEPYRADEYGFAVARLSQRFVDASAFLAPADCWGDVGAASGPLFVSLVVAGKGRRGAETGYNLLWTSSESGERCAAILEQYRGPTN
jgi:3-oxoacyl-[acyl-carrier-protein] synthase-1